MITREPSATFLYTSSLLYRHRRLSQVRTVTYHPVRELSTATTLTASTTMFVAPSSPANHPQQDGKRLLPFGGPQTLDKKLTQTTRLVTSPARIQSSSADPSRPSTSSVNYGRVVNWPHSEPHVRPVVASKRDIEEIEAHIDENIMPPLRDCCRTYSVGVIDFLGRTTIMILVENSDEVQLANSWHDVPIVIGRGRAEIHVHANFSTDVVRPRIGAPAIGASLGSLGTRGAGTLGLYVRNQNGKLSILTTYHNVCQECVSSTRNNLKVTSPMLQDLETLQVLAEKQLPHLRDQLSNYIFRCKPKVASRYEEQIEAAESLLNFCPQDCMIGHMTDHVLIMGNNEYVDAALIDVDESKLNGWHSEALNDPLIDFDADGGLPPSQSRLTSILDQNSLLEKVGRTTARTSGYINPSRLRSAMDTPYGLVEDFTAWGVMAHKRRGAMFSEPGDSGAIVYNGKQPLGMVFGGVMGELEGRAVDITLITPLSRLQELLKFDLL